jgi:hypothetical protein
LAGLEVVTGGSFLCGWLGAPAQVAVFEPVGIAFEGDHLGVVHETVDHRRGDDLVTEHLSPPAERLVAGHDQARPLIPGRYQLEEQVGGLGLERDVADLVDDQDGVTAEPGELGLKVPGVVCAGEPGDPFGTGEPIPMSPSGTAPERTAFQVHSFQANQWLLWSKPDSTWAWSLTPTSTGGTRLVTRIRALYDWQYPLAGLTALLLMEFGDFAMLRRMLRGIKARAESGSRNPPPPQ